jgi:hypothetical protein
MAYGFGNTVNPQLGATNYSGYLQGALSGAQMQAQGGAAIAQGLAQGIASGVQGIQKYQEKKEKKAQEDAAITSFQKIATTNPTIAKSLGFDANDRGAAKAFVTGVGGPAAAINIANSLEQMQQAEQERNRAEQAARISGLYRQGDGRMLSMVNERSFDPVALEQGYGAYLRDALTQSQIAENQAQARGAGAPKTPSDVGTIPQGYRAVRNNIGQVISLEPIPGFTPDTSETDLRKMQIAEAKRKEAADEEAKKRKQEQYNFRVVNQYKSAQNVIDQIDESIEMANAVGSTGLIGATVALVPGTPQFDLSQKLSTILANIGFDRLQQMREESPTGGALGQVAVQELVALQNSIASLSQKQSGEQLAANLKRVKQKYSTFATALEKDFNKIPKDPSQMTEEEILQELGGRK